MPKRLRFALLLTSLATGFVLAACASESTSSSMTAMSGSTMAEDSDGGLFVFSKRPASAPPPPNIRVMDVEGADTPTPVLMVQVTSRGSYRFTGDDGGGNESFTELTLSMKDKTEKKFIFPMNATHLGNLNNPDVDYAEIQLSEAIAGDDILHAEVFMKIYAVGELSWELNGWCQLDEVWYH